MYPLNPLYSSCDSHNYKHLDRLELRFTVKFPAVKEVRRADVNMLYFNVLDKLPAPEDSSFMHEMHSLLHAVQSIDKEGSIAHRFGKMVRSLSNGTNEFITTKD